MALESLPALSLSGMGIAFLVTERSLLNVRVSSGFQNALIEEEIALEQGDLSGQVVDGTKAASILHQIAQDDARLEQLVDGLGLGGVLDKAFRSFHGRDTKITAARALASTADTLILDEPFQGLDASLLLG